MKKKIIISNYDDLKNPYYAGGGATAIHEVAKRLIENYQVTVITSRYPKSSDAVIDGVYYKRIGLSFVPAKAAQLIYQLLLPIYTLKESYDLWIENFTPPFTTSFLPLFTKKEVIGVVHMLPAEDMERKYRLPFRYVENLGIKCYKKIIVTQNGIKNKIQEINKTANIQVIPNGVDIKIKKSGSKRMHILFLGRIEVDQKGLDLLIRSFSELKDKTNLPFVIAGNGEEGQIKLLKELLKKEGLTKRVKLVGRVEGSEKDLLIKQAVCLVVPSRFETFSMVSLEALAYGVPLITFDIDGLKWIPSSVRYKVKPFDTHGLAKKIAEIIEKKNDLLNKSAKGREFAAKFDWDTISKSYISYTQKNYGTTR